MINSAISFGKVNAIINVAGIFEVYLVESRGGWAGGNLRCLFWFHLIVHTIANDFLSNVELMTMQSINSTAIASKLASECLLEYVWIFEIVIIE